MSKIVDFTGFAANVVLAEIYNRTRPIGMGLYQYQAKLMTPNEAQICLDEVKKYSRNYFDYLKGRPLKLSFDDYPKLDAKTYDEYNGDKTGTLADVLAHLKKGQMTSQVPREAPTKAELDQTLKECDRALKVTSFDPYS